MAAETDVNEQRRIAHELGIDFEDLSLMPSQKDLRELSTPARREIKSSNLQAVVWNDMELEGDNNTSDALVEKLRNTVFVSPVNTPKHFTFTQFRKKHFSMTPKAHNTVRMTDREHWKVDTADGELDLIFTKEYRARKRNVLFLWTTLDFFLFVYITFLLAFFWKQW